MAEHLDFLDFVAERLEVERKKAVGLPRPWTQDPVIRDTRFTNIDRNHDRGTIKLFEKVRDLPQSEMVLYVVLFRCAYSNLGLLDRFTLERVKDLKMLVTDTVKLPGRKPYQVYLNENQTMMDFLVTTGTSVAGFISDQLPGLNGATIESFADMIADHFKLCHGRRFIFLATEIVKDLSVLLPSFIDPNSECNMNVGAKKGLKLISPGRNKAKLANLAQRSRLNPSVLEHALCEYSKYVERWKHFDKEKCFKTSWIYHPSTVPLVAFKDAVDKAA